MGTDCSSTAVSAFELDGAASDCTTTAAVRVELVVGASFVGSLSSLPERRFTKSDPSADISPWISRCSTAVGACGRDQGDAIAPLLLERFDPFFTMTNRPHAATAHSPTSEATTAMMTVVSSPSSPLEIAVSTPSISTYPGGAYGGDGNGGGDGDGGCDGGGGGGGGTDGGGGLGGDGGNDGGAGGSGGSNGGGGLGGGATHCVR